MGAVTGDGRSDIAFGSSTRPTTWGPGSESSLPPIRIAKLKGKREIFFEAIKNVVLFLRRFPRQEGSRKEVKK